MSNSEVLGHIDAAWNTWLFAINDIPDDRSSEPVTGGWSLKDLMGHTAFWDSQVAIQALQRAAGELPNEIDFMAMNDEDFAQNVDNAVVEQRQRMMSAHEEMTRVLTAQPEIEPDWVGDETYFHYSEHAAEVIAWRQAQGL